MKLFVVVTCWIGIAAVAAGDDEEEEIESLKVSEGGNLTISIHFSKHDRDPQVLVSRLQSSSEESIAQLICHDEDCNVTQEGRSGVSLMFDGQNATLILTNITDSQSGLYKVSKLSSARQENKIYNVTVFEAPLRAIRPDSRPSASFSGWFTAGVIAAAAVVTGAATAVLYRTLRHKGKNHHRATMARFHEVSQDDDTSSSGP